MTRMFRTGAGDRSRLRGRTVAVLGFGNQGRAQALNLRDSGLTVIVGNRNDGYADQARADGIETVAIPDAAGRGDIVMSLLPDEVLDEVFAAMIGPKLRPSSMFVVPTGYNLAFGDLDIPAGVDVAMLAPRMIGTGVRQSYLDGGGFHSFISVERDATGSAWPTLLALADAVGTLTKGAMELSATMEAELDLFNEQAFGPAFGRVLLSAINTLLEAGYPKEAVLLELYLSGEFGHIFSEVAEIGLFANLEHHSPASQYGAISRGIKFLRFNFKPTMRKILGHIRSGGFAREWRFERRTGRLRARFLKAMALRQPLRQLERETLKRLREGS
jgi:ketol-acid reductoisomerase